MSEAAPSPLPPPPRAGRASFGALYLATRHLAFHRGRAVLLALALGLTAFVPLAVYTLVARYSEGLLQRAQQTPLVLGTSGQRFDRIFNALYFRAVDLEPVPWSEVQIVVDSGLGTPVPLHARFTARGRPLVGTTPEYHELRGLQPAAGTAPLRLAEATLGAKLADDLGLVVGDSLLSDPKDLYDLAASYPLKLRVVGIFAATGTVDDEAVFVDVKTAWAIAGLAHGHAEVGTAGQGSTADPGLPELQAVGENRDRFHLHGDFSAFPLTSLIVVPHDDKSATLLRARTNARGDRRMLNPVAVIEELLGFVLRIQRFFELHQAFTGLATLLFLGVLVGLSARMRREERDTLHKLGASRLFTTRVLAVEWLLLMAAGLVLAGLGLFVLWLVMPATGLPV